MALRILNRFPGASVRVLSILQEPDPDVVFAADPQGAASALWFNFRIEDPEPPAPVPASLTLTLRFFDTLAGDGNPEHCRPVTREPGKGWNRLRAPVVTRMDDGQPLLQWTIPYPATRIEIAFCHPYGREELDALMQRTKGCWREEAIGLSQGGRLLARLDNRADGRGGAHAPCGLYLLARQTPGESPGSWMLDGMLETLARARPGNWCIWAVPFADPDGVHAGNHGNAAGTLPDLAWGTPPARHETQVLQSDLRRWAARCRPELVLALNAAAPCEHQGIHAGDGGSASETARSSQAWANVLRQALGAEFAADPFVRETAAAHRAEAPSMHRMGRW